MLDRMIKREHEEFLFAAMERLSHKTESDRKINFIWFILGGYRSTVFSQVSLMFLVEKSKLFMEYL